VDGRTRGAKPSGGYREPGDDEGLPGPEGWNELRTSVKASPISRLMMYGWMY
jgi:hypothetical protein